MEVGLFDLPSVGRIKKILRLVWQNLADLYQEMLFEITEQLQYADEHGYYGCGTTEHHFHVEGEDVSTNPVLLNVYFGSKTKNMKFGQLGNVLPSRNPINLAEDIAMMSQMNKGRAFAGFARGYQPRWVNVIGQKAGLSDPAEGEILKSLRENFRGSILRYRFCIGSICF